jgi:hypothetical protein
MILWHTCRSANFISSFVIVLHKHRHLIDNRRGANTCNTLLTLKAISGVSALHALVGSHVAQRTIRIAGTLIISDALDAETIAGLAVLSGRALCVCLASIVDNLMRGRLVLLGGSASHPQANQDEGDQHNTDDEHSIPVETKDLSIRWSLRSRRARSLGSTHSRHFSLFGNFVSFFFDFHI